MTKKIIKIITSIILVLIVALVTIPYLLRDDIEKFIKEEVNNAVNAKVDYRDLRLSLLKDFPNLHVSLSDLSVVGEGVFDSIHLADIQDFNFSLNAKKLLFNDDLEIKKIRINHANLNIVVTEDGKANYDIAKTETDSSQVHKSYVVRIENYEIANSNLSYKDALSKIKIKLRNIKHEGSGKFSSQDYRLKTKTTADTLDFILGKIHYINNAKADLQSDITIENDFKKYTLPNISLVLNNLEIEGNSVVELKNDEIDMNINYQSKKNELKQFLSMIPKAYMPDLKGIKTGGTANLKGFVKGIYKDKIYPAYAVNFKVENGTIKYPDLSEDIKNLNIVTKVDFPGGKNPDRTEINMSKIHFSVAGSPADGSLRIANPMTDPLIDTYFKSKLDLNKLKNAVKMPQIRQLSGLLDADIKLKGRISAIQNKEFDKFNASGYFDLNNMNYAADSLPYAIHISQAKMKISPQALKLNTFDAKVGKSDFHLQGKLSNYIAYLFNKTQTLKADFNMHSDYLNLNEFMSEEQNKTTDSAGVIKIPKNLDINFTADADKVTYKDMNLTDMKGNLKLKDEKANLSAVLMKTLDGQMHLTGTYDTSKEKPVSDFNIEMQKMSITKSANTLSTFGSYAPVLKKIRGQFFSNMKMRMDLDEKMNPILGSVNAEGDFNTANIQIDGIDIVKDIGKMLKINELSNPKIDKIKAQFSIANGQMQVKPFRFKINNIQSGLSGKVGLDKKIEFVLNMDVPRALLGNNANQILEGLVGNLSKLGLKTDLGKIIKMKFKISGDYRHPKITPLIAGYEGQSTQEIVTQVVEEKVEQVIDSAKIVARAKAQAEADRIMKLAQTQADSLISKARQLSAQIKLQADKQAKNLIKEAGSNPFKKLAAQTAAKEINRQAEQKGNKLVAEAQNKANLILKNAKAKADKLIQGK